MSSIATFYLLDKSKLDGLVQSAEIITRKTLFSKKVADYYPEYLKEHTVVQESPDIGGYVFASLLVYLEEEKNIDLLNSPYNSIGQELLEKRGSAHFIFTSQQKEEHLHSLKADHFSIKEIQKFNKDFSEDEDVDTARQMLLAIETLHTHLAKLKSDDQILLLIIG